MQQPVKVCVRFRPLNSGDSVPGELLVSVDEEKSTVALSRGEKKGLAEFTFSKVFGPQCNQKALYAHCGLVQDVVEGFNCCIMAYGQTGSGKTFTMYGGNWEESPDVAKKAFDSDMNSVDGNEDELQSLDDELTGIIPRAVNDLFKLLDQKSAISNKFDFSVNCQIMQIYNEKIYDLLQDRKRENPLQIRDSKREDDYGTIHVRGMSVFRTYSSEETFALLRKGLRNRAIRATDFNAESSRSHTILQLFVTVEEEDEQGLMVLRRSTFSLVDLAGSEKWRPSLSQAGSSDAQLKEMTNINTSLHVLGNCVSALIEPGRKHIPYRDSVLTRLLQDSLGGHGKTIFIATVHSDPQYREESYSTLQFASRASCIKVTVAANVGVNDRVNLEEAQKQIKMLRGRLLEYQLQDKGSKPEPLSSECAKCPHNVSLAKSFRKLASNTEELLQRYHVLAASMIPQDAFSHFLREVYPLQQEIKKMKQSISKLLKQGEVVRNSNNAPAAANSPMIRESISGGILVAESPRHPEMTNRRSKSSQAIRSSKDGDGASVRSTDSASSHLSRERLAADRSPNLLGMVAAAVQPGPMSLASNQSFEDLRRSQLVTGSSLEAGSPALKFVSAGNGSVDSGEFLQLSSQQSETSTSRLESLAHHQQFPSSASKTKQLKQKKSSSGSPSKQHTPLATSEPAVYHQNTNKPAAQLLGGGQQRIEDAIAAANLVLGVPSLREQPVASKPALGEISAASHSYLDVNQFSSSAVAAPLHRAKGREDIKGDSLVGLDSAAADKTIKKMTQEAEAYGGGRCRKHGLDHCVLCTMFASKEQQQQSSAPALSPPALISNNFTNSYSQQFTANSEPNWVASQVPSMPSPVASTSQLQSDRPCNMHGVTDCLLCAMKRSAQGSVKPSFQVQASNAEAPSIAQYQSQLQASFEEPAANISADGCYIPSMDSADIGYGFPSSKSTSKQRYSQETPYNAQASHPAPQASVSSRTDPRSGAHDEGHESNSGRKARHLREIESSTAYSAASEQRWNTQPMQHQPHHQQSQGAATLPVIVPQHRTFHQPQVLHQQQQPYYQPQIHAQHHYYLPQNQQQYQGQNQQPLYQSYLPQQGGSVYQQHPSQLPSEGASDEEDDEVVAPNPLGPGMERGSSAGDPKRSGKKKLKKRKKSATGRSRVKATK